MIINAFYAERVTQNAPVFPSIEQEKLNGC